MKLIIKKSSAKEKYDDLRCLRNDMSETSARMPRQGILPHDLLHYVVERKLRYELGFFGLIAKGADIAFVMEQVHDLGAEKLADQASHAESIVESLQAQLWSGAFDPIMFSEGVRVACAARGCSPPDLSHIDPEQDFYEEALDMARRWQAVQPYGVLELEISFL